ncbi:MAG: DUF998 domain-containing protein [Acidimicrobiales bacterium]
MRAWAGVAGPLTFIGTWSLLGAIKADYSPVNDPISRLAAVDSPQRAAMTGAFLIFGIGVSAFAAEVRQAFPGAAPFTLATTAVATIGVAATPIGSALGATPHAVAAGISYASLAATPVLTSRHLPNRAASMASLAVGLASGSSLLASALAPRGVGLLQRVGLTLGDAWIVATALWMASRRDARPPQLHTAA